LFWRGYPQRIDTRSFLDYYLFINVLDLTDNVGKNFYLARHDANSSLTIMPWDLDGSLGSKWDKEYSEASPTVISNTLFKRLMGDPAENGFASQARIRWNELRKGVLSQSALTNRLREQEAHLRQNGVYRREELVWKEYSYDPRYLTRTENWLVQRLAYLDAYFNLE